MNGAKSRGMASLRPICENLFCQHQKYQGLIFSVVSQTLGFLSCCLSIVLINTVFDDVELNKCTFKLIWSTQHSIYKKAYHSSKLNKALFKYFPTPMFKAFGGCKQFEYKCKYMMFELSLSIFNILKISYTLNGENVTGFLSSGKTQTSKKL